MDAKISGNLPDFIVYDIGDRPDLSGGKKAEKTFIGSRVGEINVNGKMESAVIFYRVPISKLGALQPKQTRSEAKQAARHAIEHFQKMLIKGGANPLSAAQATNASLIPDDRLSKEALDLTLFEKIAVVNIKIPVISSAAGISGEIQPHTKVLEEARARKPQGASGLPRANMPPLPSTPSADKKTSKPLPPLPQARTGKPAQARAKPLPAIPSNTPSPDSAPQTPGNPLVTGFQANPNGDLTS